MIDIRFSGTLADHYEERLKDQTLPVSVRREFEKVMIMYRNQFILLINNNRFFNR